MTTEKTRALTRWTFVGKVMSLLFNKLVIAFLPSSKCLLISWLQSPSAVILEPKKIVSHCFHCFPSICPSILEIRIWVYLFKGHHSTLHTRLEEPTAVSLRHLVKCVLSLKSSLPFQRLSSSSFINLPASLRNMDQQPKRCQHEWGMLFQIAYRYDKRLRFWGFLKLGKSSIKRSHSKGASDDAQEECGVWGRMFVNPY